MRDWLILKLTAFIQWVLAPKKTPTRPPEEEVRETCPVCGIDWDKGEIFCYNCGYELRDESYPLNPPPERTGSITDPDCKLDKDSAAKYRLQLDAVASEKGWDIAIFVMPSALKSRIQAVPPEEHLDGIAFELYNTWQIGKNTGLKGMLLAIDPSTADRALALGRNGPRITGSTFREWYSSMNVTRLDEELGHIISKISSF